MQTLPTTEAERLMIAEFRLELQRKQAWAEGYSQGAEYMMLAMIRSRGISGKWQISDDATELVKVE